MFKGNILPHELLLTTRPKTKPRYVNENNMSTNIKLSKTQMSKTIQSGGFLGSLISKIVGLLVKVTIPLAKYISAPLGITAAASAIDPGIQKKKKWFWNNNSDNFKWRNKWHNENCSSSWGF